MAQRQAEVGDLDPLDAVLQQDVRRLDVAMDQALGVRRGQPERRLHADPKDFLGAQRAVAVDPVLERSAVDAGHHQVREAGLRIGVDGVDGDDVIVDDRRGGLGLAEEPPTCGAAGGELRGEDLDGHHPVQRRVDRLEDDPHAPLAQHPDDLVRPESSQVLGIVGGCQEIEVGSLAADGRSGLSPRSARRETRHRRIRSAPEVSQVVPEPAPAGEPLERLLAGATVIEVTGQLGLIVGAQVVVEVGPQPVRIALRTFASPS